MNSITHADEKVNTFVAILARLAAGEISQAEADRQVDALNTGAAYLREQALPLEAAGDPRLARRQELARETGSSPTMWK